MRIERRAFVGLPVWAAMGVVPHLIRELSAQDRPEKITFDDFVAQTGAMAKKLIADAGRGQGEYLHQVAAMAERIDRVPDVKMGAPFKGVIRSALNYRGSGIVVVQWSMEKGLRYPAHNHPNYNGITLGLEGECRIRTFDPIGVLPEMTAKTEFRLQETQNQLMTPGTVVSVMSPARNNIHTLHTYSKNVRGIDVMTLVGKHVGFAMVEIDDAQRNDEGLYAARWSEHYPV